MKRLPLVLTLIAAFMIAGLLSCEKEVEKIVEAEPAIQVDTVTVESTDITQGQTVYMVPSLTFREDASVDQANLQYAWFVDGGMVVTTSEDTAWWEAPAEDGVYKAIVQVTDGTNSGVGSTNLGVDVYAPGASVYYVGDAECANCHGDVHDAWAGTGHADAWAGLQESDHVQSFCVPCHTVDYSAFEVADNASMNSGYDEVPIAKFEDVQCESCHGPASDHIASPSEALPGLSIETDVCSVCHDGTHHPFQTQWAESAHNFDPATAAHGAGERTYGCQECHSGQGFIEMLEPTEYEGLHADALAAGELDGVTCTVCHDPHSGDNPGQLRTLQAVTLVGGELLDTGKEGQLCMQCHKARRDASTQIDSGYAHFGPHSSVQGDAVYGASGYEGVASNITGFQSSGHGLIADACASCHVYATEFDPVTDFANVGHTFEPRVESCNECHAQESGAAFDNIADVRTLRPKDYDADGSIEPLQTEVEGLVATLVEVLVVNYPDSLSGTDVTMPATSMADSLTNTVGDGSAEAQEFREAGYNLVYVLNDGSLGIHNPAYIVQLLQQSILFVDGTQLNGGSPNNLYDASDVPAGLTAMR